MHDSDLTDLPSRKLEFQAAFSLLVVAIALLITWLVLGASSPFENYFAHHGDIPEWWQVTVVIPMLISVMISGNAHSPPMPIFLLALIIQWIVLGYLFSIPAAKIWFRLQK